LLGFDEKDNLHRLVAGKYLKELLMMHEKKGTIDIHKNDIAILSKQCDLPECV